MRVNHSGEVCAQALYQGQALTARGEAARGTLERAAAEETEHLAWTAQRIDELGGRLSVLNPLLYAGSFAIGALSGFLGDKWNMGFLAETERQVEGHLDGHLEQLPPQDDKSRAIVAQMKEDEARHANTALANGAAELPAPVQAGDADLLAPDDGVDLPGLIPAPQTSTISKSWVISAVLPSMIEAEQYFSAES